MEVNTEPNKLIKIPINKLERNSLTELPKKLGYFYSGVEYKRGFYSRSGFYLGSMEQIRSCDLEWPVISNGKIWEDLGNKRNKIRNITVLDLERMGHLKGGRLETKTISFYGDI